MSFWLKAVDRREVRYPPAPQGQILYAIGDIHGRADLLRRAHSAIDDDVAERCARDRATEVYLGDYVDRGPDSKGVLDLLIARSEIAPIIALRGNHEIAMESFLRGLLPFEEWRPLGGLETIRSYGVDARSLLEKGPIQPVDFAREIPVSHLRFFSTLKLLWRIGRYCFVHAGLKPGIPIEQQSTDDLVWIREEFLNSAGDFGAIVVHGHSPVQAIEFLPNRINIDTGAYATNRLSVIRIDADGVSALEPASR